MRRSTSRCSRSSAKSGRCRAARCRRTMASLVVEQTRICSTSRWASDSASDRMTTSARATAPDDGAFMRRALALAERGWGQTAPNPLVGAVVVRDDVVVGEGWHARYGAPHAEVEALRNAGDRAPGATLYVSLEPCNHFGKTPPCTDAILAAGIRRVVA